MFLGIVYWDTETFSKTKYQAECDKCFHWKETGLWGQVVGRINLNWMASERLYEGGYT